MSTLCRAYSAYQRASSGPLSFLKLCVCERRRPWRECAEEQNYLDLRVSPMQCFKISWTCSYFYLCFYSSFKISFQESLSRSSHVCRNFQYKHAGARLTHRASPATNASVGNAVEAWRSVFRSENVHFLRSTPERVQMGTNVHLGTVSRGRVARNSR